MGYPSHYKASALTMKSKSIYLLFVALIALIVCAVSVYFPATQHITLSNLISEAIVSLIVLIAVILVNHDTTSNSKQSLVKFGLSLLFVSLLADTMDEIRAVPDLYSLLFEDIPELLGYAVLLVGITGWLKLDASYKEKLKSLAKIDALTNSLNRRAFNDILTKELARSERSGHRLALAMIDIDHFKQLNDNYGHAFGDYILKEFCGIISSKIRRIDVFCRWGGEEFIILLPETTPDEALVIIESLRMLIESTTFTIDNHVEAITFSAGLASYPEHLSEDALIKNADDALYQAKSNGRNNTVLI